VDGRRPAPSAIHGWLTDLGNNAQRSSTQMYRYFPPLPFYDPTPKTKFPQPGAFYDVLAFLSDVSEMNLVVHYLHEQLEDVVELGDSRNLTGTYASILIPLFENTEDSRVFAYAVAFLATASGAKGWREVKSIVDYNVADRLGQMGEGMNVAHQLGSLTQAHFEADGKNERSPAYLAHPDKPVQILGRTVATVTQSFVDVFHEERRMRKEREDLEAFREWQRRRHSERLAEEKMRDEESEDDAEPEQLAWSFAGGEGGSHGHPIVLDDD